MSNILKLVADALEVDESRVTQATTSADIEEWDSLGQLSIVSTLAANTNGESDKVDLANCFSVADLSQKLSEAGLKFED